MKPENFLLHDKKPDSALKIIDFGLAVQLSDLTEERETLCGTPNYISPEVILNRPYGLQADLWSLGCIMFAMMTGKPPFECATVQDTLVRIKSGKFVIPADFSSEAADLINKLLTQDPTVRMTIADVFNHAFLKHLAPLEDKSAKATVTEDVGKMMLTDLTEEAKAIENPGMVETLDAIAYKTLDAEDRNAFKQ